MLYCTLDYESQNKSAQIWSPLLPPINLLVFTSLVVRITIVETSKGHLSTYTHGCRSMGQGTTWYGIFWDGAWGLERTVLLIRVTINSYRS
jgi:hypothetical protein